MLLTKEVTLKWSSNNKQWYESKGYKFTKWKDELTVKVEDLLNGSHARVDVKCDKCGKIKNNLEWYNYKNHIKDNDKYYCHKCVNELSATTKANKTKLKNSISFYDWCYENLPKEEADKIMLRWDYNLNIKNGKILSPKNVTYGSQGFNKKGYWFKCLDCSNHISEQKSITRLEKRNKDYIICNKCNSIATTHPELVKYFVNKEDALKYSASSGEKILMKCPNCGIEKKKIIYTLLSKGFGCPKCSDSVSYPEKFMFNVLEQLLGKDFQVQLSKTTFKWCNNYRYDFYIEKINCIIETHGLQHYEENKIWSMSLKETQENDEYKEQLAKNNGIKHYTPVDCRKSDIEWIKNSIMQSELPNLLNFKEENINWLKCHEYACSSKVKEACDLWNNGIRSASKIGNKLKTHKGTITEYLKQGVELGWCNYNAKEEKKNRFITALKVNCKKVICLNTKEIFNSLKEGASKYNIIGSLSPCCRGKKESMGKHPITGEPLKWMYYDEYLKTQTLFPEELSKNDSSFLIA